MENLDKTNKVSCHECGEQTYGWRQLEPQVWATRDGVDYLTPEGLEGWGCTTCGEFEFGEEQLRAIKTHVQGEIAKYEAARLRAFVGEIEETTGLNRSAIAKACGIHYTYLSKIINGRKAAGAPLAKLIEVYAQNPGLLVRERVIVAQGGFKVHAKLEFHGVLKRTTPTAFVDSKSNWETLQPSKRPPTRTLELVPSNRIDELEQSA